MLTGLAAVKQKCCVAAFNGWPLQRWQGPEDASAQLLSLCCSCHRLSLRCAGKFRRCRACSTLRMREETADARRGIVGVLPKGAGRFEEWRIQLAHTCQRCARCRDGPQCHACPEMGEARRITRATIHQEGLLRPQFHLASLERHIPVVSRQMVRVAEHVHVAWQIEVPCITGTVLLELRAWVGMQLLFVSRFWPARSEVAS